METITKQELANLKADLKQGKQLNYIRQSNKVKVKPVKQQNLLTSLLNWLTF